MGDQRKVEQVSVWDEDPGKQVTAERVQALACAGPLLLSITTVFAAFSDGLVSGIAVTWTAIFAVATLVIHLRGATAAPSWVRTCLWILGVVGAFVVMWWWLD